MAGFTSLVLTSPRHQTTVWTASPSSSESAHQKLRAEHSILRYLHATACAKHIFISIIVCVIVFKCICLGGFEFLLTSTIRALNEFCLFVLWRVSTEWMVPNLGLRSCARLLRMANIWWNYRSFIPMTSAMFSNCTCDRCASNQTFVSDIFY